jgi:hypothetical protein
MTDITWLTILFIVLLVALLGCVLYGISQTRLFFRITNRNIRDSVQLKSLDIKPDSQNLIELAVEIWRIQKRLQKAKESLSDDQNKAFENSSSKLQRYLEKNDISVVDYTDQKYNEGLNLDVLSIEKDPSISGSIIKETHEPAVLHKGQLIKKAKVVVLEK